MVAQAGEAEDGMGTEEGIDVLHVELSVAGAPHRPRPEVAHYLARVGGQD